MGGVLPALGGLSRAALDLLYPRWCIGCGREGAYVCRSCRDTFSAITGPVCNVCGRPATGAGPCRNCEGRELATDGIRAPFLFEGAVRQAIHDLKYRNLRGLAPFLAGLLYDYLRQHPLPGDVLVPVPLHPRRLRRRGYNQALLLARELGKLSGLPVRPEALERTRYADPQARSRAVEERRARMAGAFISRDNGITGKYVILIDDVTTSGATLSAGAAALKMAGAAGVRGLTAALEL